MWPHAQETVGLVTFTIEILNGKLHFCAVCIEFFGQWSFRKQTAKIIVAKHSILDVCGSPGYVFDDDLNEAFNHIFEELWSWLKKKLDPAFHMGKKKEINRVRDQFKLIICGFGGKVWSKV